MDRRLWTRGVHRVCEGCDEAAWRGTRCMANGTAFPHQVGGQLGSDQLGTSSAPAGGDAVVAPEQRILLAFGARTAQRARLAGAVGGAAWVRSRVLARNEPRLCTGETSFEERVLLAAPRRGAADHSNLCGLMQSRVARLLQCARPRRGCWQCELCVARQPFSSRQLKCVCKCPCCSCACAQGAHELLRLARDAKRRTVDTHAIAMIRSGSRLCRRGASTNTPRRIISDSLHRDCAP